MDRLAPFFERFSSRLGGFIRDACAEAPEIKTATMPDIFMCSRKGRLKITRPDAGQIVIDTQGILFFPRPRLHRLHGPEEEGAELVCATIEFGAGMLNPLIASLEPLVLPLDALPERLCAANEAVTGERPSNLA